MKIVRIEKTDKREFLAYFTRKMEYAVRVTVPDGVEVLLEDGTPYVVVSEPVGNGAPMQIMKSLQVAAEEGLVSVVSV